MKLKILLEATKGNWNIQNLNGIMKTFKDPQSAEAQAWMRNRDSHTSNQAKSKSQKMQTLRDKYGHHIDDDTLRRWHASDKADEAEEKRQAREDAREEKRKPTPAELDKIHMKAEEFVGNSWPDGDPYDGINRWMDRQGYKGEWLDLAFKKHTKKTFNDYLADMWDSTAADHLYDAQQTGQMSDFVRFDDQSGKVPQITKEERDFIAELDKVDNESTLFFWAYMPEKYRKLVIELRSHEEGRGKIAKEVFDTVFEKMVNETKKNYSTELAKIKKVSSKFVYNGAYDGVCALLCKIVKSSNPWK